MGVEPYLTATAVDCVIAQRLARRLCERCKRPVEIEREILEALNFPSRWRAGGGVELPQGGRVRAVRGHGVPGPNRHLRDDARGRGAEGGDTAARLDRGARQIARRGGMVSLRDDALVKAASGVSTIEEVLKNVV